MGLFGSGKSDEEKLQERVAKALDEMGITVESAAEKDGSVHVGCFQGALGLSSYKNLSMTMEGVLGFLQTNGREIVDVKVSPCGSGDTIMSQLVTVLYR
ncbi:hypothetical protein B5F40_12335 [Gordonibacter sp. An230]|uniref:hypothetical protein n=1 Tax=Gordonibacter sp. An230 TaxID=1965592 RepID=UPI000B38C93C|nr:hypothetical protein [Gordonibacter sp. An230]OUO88636.1 hypothetical protein B5F40_12335 [Gordonibacter sp. An230]